MKALEIEFKGVGTSPLGPPPGSAPGCCPQIANQLTGFYVRATLALNGLIILS